MKNILVWVAVCAVAVAARDMRAETSQQRGKRVVQECVDALGGDKFLAMKNRVEIGRAYSFYREQLNGLTIARISVRYLDHVADPGSTLAVVEREDFGKKFDYGVLFTQDDAYDITFRGARPLATDRVQRYKESTLRDVFYILRERLHEPGIIFESRGADVWNNNPVEIVDIIDGQNRTTTVYFHQLTKLPLRQIMKRVDEKTRDRVVEETLFNKYRDVDGVKWPLTVQRQRDGEKIFELFADSVEINKELPDTFFTLPSNIKRLKPE